MQFHLKSWNAPLDGRIRSSGYSLSGARGTWIRFVLVQIGTRRLGTRSGLACQLARVPRTWDALGFSHRIPGTRAARESARERLMNYCADLERLRSFLSARSRARMKRSSTKRSGNSTLKSSFHKGDFVRANCPGQLLCGGEFRRKFREEISLEAFNPVIFYPRRSELLAPWPVVPHGETRENLGGRFYGLK